MVTAFLTNCKTIETKVVFLIGLNELSKLVLALKALVELFKMVIKAELNIIFKLKLDQNIQNVTTF